MAKIRDIKKELSQIEKYFIRSENLRDEQQLDDFMQKYGLHSKRYIKTEEGFKFLEKTPIKAFHEAIMLMDESNVKHFNVFRPESPDKLIAAMESLFKGISFSFIFTLVLFFLFSLVLRFTNISDGIIPGIVICIN